jgi:DNA-directed RNA polymerase I subunit RPA1
MAGREGLTDTAVKTANTGYLQRCLIKHVEGIHVAYDGTVRNADGSIVEFLYGEDGIDAVNSRYLSRFEFMERNYDAYVAKLRIADVVARVDCDTAMAVLDAPGPRARPLQAQFPPHRFVGSVSEAFEDALTAHCALARHEIAPEKLRAIAVLNFFRSVVQPGEAVGVVAAQAIGEPATQMTLNTFHLAGYGGTNVTLGIPRLREILVVATRAPTTPTMTIPLLTDDRDVALTFVRQFNRVALRDCVRAYSVAEDFFTAAQLRRDRQITVAIDLIPEFAAECGPARLSALRTAAARLLKRKIGAVFRTTGARIVEADAEVAAGGAHDTRGEAMGADLAKRHERKDQKHAYDDDDERPAKPPPQADADALTDENVSCTYDSAAARITVTYVVSNDICCSGDAHAFMECLLIPIQSPDCVT